MGNSNCCAYTGDKEESELSSNIVYDPHIAPSPHIDRDTEPLTTRVPPNALKPLALKVEALWLGHSTRRQLVHYRRAVSHNHSYFGRAECQETLQALGPPYRSYTYRSGSIYTGDWLGGFRHGFGAQTYPSGDKFEGQWSYGVPYGSGRFTYADGESFEGSFRQYYMSPKEMFQSHSNLSKWKDLVVDGYSNV